MIKSNLRPALKYYRVGNVCCGDDFFQVESSRYDLERLGVVESSDLEVANLLIVQGYLSDPMYDVIKKVLQNKTEKTWILSLGVCACGGGLFPNSQDREIKADVWVPGCPPRPEAIMNGVIAIRTEQSK